MKYIKSVSIKNFFSYGPQETTLDLSGNGLANISGVNGVGKSTIIEAMLFALYGKTRQEVVKDVVNREVGKDCKVSVEFVGDDDEVYKVIRYRAHSTQGDKVYIFKGDKDISKKNTSDTNEDIIEYFGMPYIAFVNSTVFSSEFYANFFSAKNSERLNIFENILSLKEISYFYEEVKDILKEISEKEEEVRLRFTESSTKAATAQEALDEYNKQAKEKLLELKTQKEEAQKAIEKAEEILKELNTINVVEEKAKLSNATLGEEYGKQIKEKKSLYEELDSKNIFPKEEADLLVKYGDFNFEENKAKEEKYKTDLETIKTRELGYEKAKIQMDNSSEKLSSLKSQAEVSKKEIEKCKKDLEKVEEAICPFCGQIMGAEETEKKRKEISEKIKRSEDEIADYREQYSEEKKNFDDFKETYDILLGEVNKLKEKLDKNFVANSDVIKEKYLNALKHKTEFDKTHEETCKKQAELLEEIKELETKKSNLKISKYTEEYLDSLEERIKEQNKIISDSNTAIAASNAAVKTAYDKKYVEKMKQQIEELSENSSKIKEEMKAIEDDKNHYEYLKECCSNKSNGFKKFFIGEMIPVFNEKINQYLPFFFNNKKMEVTFDKDLIEILKCNGKEITFASLSRGQKTRMEIAAAFALFGLSRVFFSNQSGLLIVDELLDNGLDEFGIKASISILESFAEDSKVFVISHNPVVKDNITDVIEVKADENGFSHFKM